METNPQFADVLGFIVAREEAHPAHSGSISWVQGFDAVREVGKAAGIRVFDPIQYVLYRSAIFMLNHPEEILSIAQVHELLKQIDKNHPGLVQEAFSGGHINLSRFTEILQELVRQGVNISDVKQIVEGVAAHCTSFGVSLSSEDEFDLSELVASIRKYRNRQLVSDQLSGRDTLRVITLGEDIEEIFDELPLVQQGNKLTALEPQQLQDVKEGLLQIIEPIRLRGVLPVLVLCREDLRTRIKSFMHTVDEQISIMSFEELQPGIQVEPVGVWGFTNHT